MGIFASLGWILTSLEWWPPWQSQRRSAGSCPGLGVSWSTLPQSSAAVCMLQCCPLPLVSGQRVTKSLVSPWLEKPPQVHLVPPEQAADSLQSASKSATLHASANAPRSYSNGYTKRVSRPNSHCSTSWTHCLSCFHRLLSLRWSNCQSATSRVQSSFLPTKLRESWCDPSPTTCNCASLYYFGNRLWYL